MMTNTLKQPEVFPVESQQCGIKQVYPKATIRTNTSVLVMVRRFFNAPRKSASIWACGAFSICSLKEDSDG